MKIKNKLHSAAGSAALTLCIAIAAIPTQAMANSAMKDQMGSMFNAMTNVTQPGVFETTRRGVIAGGSFNMRNRIMNTNVISMSSMSVRGGCGGLDFFGGSFSFINKDQFVQLLRTVASNAISYAFYLAIDSMSATIRGIMENLQKRIQELNSHFSNSCQMAQGIVTQGKKALQGELDAEFSLSSVVNSVGDTFGSFTSAEGRATKTEGLPQAEVERLTGNIVWKSMKSANTASWFQYGGSNLNQAIMSVTGTVIIGEDGPSTDGQGAAPEYTYLEGGIITIRDLVKGGTVEIYQCDDTQRCLNPQRQEVNVVGFATMINEMIIGNSSSVGIIEKYRNNTPLTQAERNLMTNLPSSAGSMITKLSRINRSFPETFVHSIAETVALQMANTMIRDFFRSAKSALDAENTPNVNDAIDRLRQAEQMFMQEYEAYATLVQPVSNIVFEFNQYLAAAGSAGISTSDSTPGINR